MKKLISYAMSLIIILSLVFIPATSVTAQTVFADDGIFTFDDASDIYGSWVGGSPAPTVTVSNGSVNADFTGQWTYACILMPIKLKAGENYTAKINYNLPVSSKLYVFYTEGSGKIDKTNNVIKKVIDFGSTSGDAESVFSFTATDDTKNILGFYIENCSTEPLNAKINFFAIKKTTTGEANLEFEDSTDVAASWKNGTGATLSVATSDNGRGVISTTLPQYSQARIALPVKLEANKTYKYKVTIRSSDALSNTIIKLFFGTASGAIGNPDNLSFVTMVNRGTVSQSYSDYSGEFTVDSSKITETNNLFSIYIKNDNATAQTYYIDSIAVSEKKTPSIKSQDTLEFTTLSDVAGTQSGDSNNVTVKQDVTNGKICVDFKAAWKNARIAFPVKLQKDTDYIFTIKYKAPQKSTYYLFAGTDEKPLYPYDSEMSPNGSKISLATGDSIKEVQFEYKASSGIINDTYNLLGLYVESSVADAYTLEIYSISYQSQSTITEGTLNFNSSLTYKKGGTYNGASAAIEEVDGTSALAVSLPKSTESDSLINLELPVKLQESKIYKYTISYNFEADTQENMWLTFASAPSGTQWVNSDKYWIERPVDNGYGLTPGAGFVTGTFASTAYQVNETNDTLYFYIKSSGQTDRKLYIKSITLELIKGDFNGDCKIGADDLICMRNALLNDVIISGADYDINKDNEVDARDVVRIKKNAIISPTGDSFQGYSLVFADDFNGTSLDSGWKLNTFNNDATMSKFSDSNYSLSDGKLTLSSQPTEDDYYTGTEMFRNDFSFSYGYFEIRAKFAVGGGNQSAFWAKANPSPGYSPEIDVFETFGHDDTITSCFHSWYENDITIPGLDVTNATAKNGKMNIQHIRNGITNMEGSNQQTIETAATEFHTYGCEWTPEYIKYYVDRVLYCTVDLTKNSSEYAVLNAEDNDIKLYISHAIVQHSLVEPVNSETQNPSNFVVDYVRLYQG